MHRLRSPRHRMPGRRNHHARRTSAARDLLSAQFHSLDGVPQGNVENGTNPASQESLSFPCVQIAWGQIATAPDWRVCTSIHLPPIGQGPIVQHDQRISDNQEPISLMCTRCTKPAGSLDPGGLLLCHVLDLCEIWLCDACLEIMDRETMVGGKPLHEKNSASGRYRPRPVFSFR